MSSGRKNLMAVLLAAVLAMAMIAAPALAHHKTTHDGGVGASQKDDDATTQSDNDDGEDAPYDDDGKPGHGPKADQGSGEDQGGKKNDGVDDKGKDGDEPYTDGAPGNNGTIKIDGEPFDTSKGQESHVGCLFRVLLWNTDEGEGLTSTLTFEAQAPTKGSFTYTDTITLGPGEPDIAGPYSLVDELIAAGIAPHPKQGWHIKLTTNTEYAQGSDVKHKVFWIKCDDTTSPTITDNGEVLGASIDADHADEAKAVEGKEASVLGSQLTNDREGNTQERAPMVLGSSEETQAAGGVLPFTGSSMVPFLLLGLGLVAIGAMFMRLRRSN